MKLILLGILAILLFPLLRRLMAKGPPTADADVSAAEKARDESFALLMRTVVVLEENAWAACAIDGIREDWKRFASGEPRGFTALPAGRHRVAAEIDGREATLDFTIAPGEIVVRRLDRASMTWTSVDGEAEARIARAASGGEKGGMGPSLVSYRATTGIARVKSGKIKSPDVELERARTALDTLLARVNETDDVEALAREAAVAGEALIGVPLVAEQLDALVAMVTDRAELMKGKRAAIFRVGLAMLPGEKRLVTLQRDS
jgi:hypothetical protein